MIYNVVEYPHNSWFFEGPQHISANTPLAVINLWNIFLLRRRFGACGTWGQVSRKQEPVKEKPGIRRPAASGVFPPCISCYWEAAVLEDVLLQEWEGGIERKPSQESNCSSLDPTNGQQSICMRSWIERSNWLWARVWRYRQCQSMVFCSSIACWSKQWWVNFHLSELVLHTLWKSEAKQKQR